MTDCTSGRSLAQSSDKKKHLEKARVGVRTRFFLSYISAADLNHRISPSACLRGIRVSAARVGPSPLTLKGVAAMSEVKRVGNYDRSRTHVLNMGADSKQNQRGQATPAPREGVTANTGARYAGVKTHVTHTKQIVPTVSSCRSVVERVGRNAKPSELS